MLCEDQPSMQQMGPIQFGITGRTNNRAGFKMNFRFQDEKETEGHELLGDTCREQGLKPEKGRKEPENRGWKEDATFILPPHRFSPNESFVPDFVLSHRHITMNKSEFLPSYTVW